ncbi:MAG: pyruvate kinase [Oscillospiraceae bacterium]|nr:pyruvate kinase [Oscillospiraceae bacterium]
MKKTKIVCTVGPATKDDDILRGMINAGMNVARFNFSHGTHESHKAALEQLKRVRKDMGVFVGALLDTKGPDVRLKTFKEPEVMLIEGESFTLYAGDFEGDKNGCSITYSGLANDVEVGSKILLNDGLVELIVTEIRASDVICAIKNNGIVKDNKSVNVPGVRLGIPYMSKRDREDIEFGIENGFDFIAASFVSRAQDVLDIRRILDINKCNKIRIIAKIENADGVENINEIMAVCDGIMIARGDMGVEIEIAQLPAIQKKLINMCYKSGKPVITATQMLESMIYNPRPTRAEVSDVANAVFDGTSAVMLSGETASGKYPVEAVSTMAAIIDDAERGINYSVRTRRSDDRKHISIADSVCHAACATTVEIGADAIMTVSKSGETARLLSKYRPTQLIYACVLNHYAARHLTISWGVYPLVMPFMPTIDEVLKESEKLCIEAGYIKSGDMIVVVAGFPAVESGTNMVTIHLVGDSLVDGAGVCGGATIGKVCVCHTDEEVIEKFQPGQILVVHNTSNNILSYVKRAAAVIAEEPGMSSHAAIVGLTLDKPVIIGATGATKNLHDGMKVSVDAGHGVVHLLEK